MSKRINIFFRRCVCSAVVVCVAVFAALLMFLATKTKETISDISNIYVSEMSVQLQQKFSSIVGLYVKQVWGIVERTPPEEQGMTEEMLEELRISASVRDFTSLGLYAQDGTVELIYGEELNVCDKHDSMGMPDKDGNLILHGTDGRGENVLILGRAAEYQMRDGRTSVALVTGLPMQDLNDILFLDGVGTLVYSHIIDVNGDFVVRNGDADVANYFERIRESYEAFNGKDVEDYVNELQNAMLKGEVYFTDILYEGSQREIYCVPLSENSSWYLITVVAGNALKERVSRLDQMRYGIVLGSAITIMVVMFVILFLYYRLSQRQMRELDEARDTAIRASTAKSEFLASMSHDIRTPMNAIIGMTEIALKNTQDAVRVEDCLKKVRLSSKHLLGLINDVLDMSKIESGKMVLNVAPMSLRDAMDDIVNIMQPQVKAKNQKFDIFIEKVLSENICCDSVRLNQILLNLLSNAVKFTPEGGRIDVHVYQEEAPEGGEYVRTHFTVVDTGIGMSEEFQKKIWDTFSREETDQVRHIVGTGLGTAITKSIVDLMGGTIELWSELGKGSSFHVTLDMKRTDESPEELRLPRWNVLVVDDNEQLCTSAVSNLEELGIHAEWTLDGKEAVEMISRRHERQDDYHFVLVDWKMPGMDGIETIHEIRLRVGSDIPVFLISAYDWNEIADEISPTVIDGFISKPLFKSTLYECLRQYVDGYSRKEELTEAEEMDFVGKRVLVAEDMEINWEVANEILSEAGLELEWAVNGKECVEKFKASEIGYYDAILMDVRMPVMNGYDATCAIRALERADSSLPIIAMTADAFSDDAQHCLECGMDAHIPKPLDIKECMRVLHKYL